MKNPCKWPPEVLYLRVLGYRDEDEKNWIAHCLELDLVGEARTFRVACAHLADLIEMQVSFAVFKGNPKLLYREAPHEYFRIFESVKREALETFPKRPRNRSYRFYDLPLKPPRKRSPSFIEAHA